jgi:hypothetical protein
MAVTEVEAIAGPSHVSQQTQLRYLEVKMREKNAEQSNDAAALAQSTVSASQPGARPETHAVYASDSMPVTGFDGNTHISVGLMDTLSSLQGRQGEGANAPPAAQEPVSLSTPLTNGRDQGLRTEANARTASRFVNSLTSVLHFVHTGDIEKAQQRIGALQGEMDAIFGARTESGGKEVDNKGLGVQSADGGDKYQLQKDFSAMMNAVRVGDLDGARSALVTYQKHSQAVKGQGGHIDSHFVSALQSLLQAVQMGNATNARAAAQSLLVTDLQSVLKAAESNAMANGVTGGKQDQGQVIIGPKPAGSEPLGGGEPGNATPAGKPAAAPEMTRRSQS